MITLVKPNFFSGDMKPFDATADAWLLFLNNPIIRKDKTDAPLFTYGVPVKKPEPGSDFGFIHAVSGNIASYRAIQLDYDEGVTMDAFIRTYGKLFAFWAYTTHSYGFKEGDRFRVVIPLSRSLPTEYMGIGYTKVMEHEFPGCDPSCFARAHFQAFPCIRAPGAPFRFHINRHRDRYSIPFDKVIEENRRSARLLRADQAFLSWNAQFGDEDSDARRIKAQLKWAQDKLDEAREGNRNMTMFSVITYLCRQHVPEYAAYDLVPPAECENEWAGMLKRIYRTPL